MVDKLYHRDNPSSGFRPAHLFLPIMSLLAVVLVCKASNKDLSVTEAMTNYDIGLVSCAQYIAIQTIINHQIEGYRQDEVSFSR